jgi:hypothetical protein
MEDLHLHLPVPHAPNLRMGFLNLQLSSQAPWHLPSPFLQSEISNLKFEISVAVAVAVAFAFAFAFSS